MSSPDGTGRSSFFWPQGSHGRDFMMMIEQTSDITPEALIEDEFA
jgi:hypothetical protein